MIDLNGHKIDRNLSYGIKAGCVMEVRGTLTIKDSSGQNGKITGGNHKGSSPSTYGGGVCLRSFAKFYVSGGSITGNTAMNGAGIAARDNSTLSISGGTISGNIIARLHQQVLWLLREDHTTRHQVILRGITQLIKNRLHLQLEKVIL